MKIDDFDQKMSHKLKILKTGPDRQKFRPTPTFWGSRHFFIKKVSEATNVVLFLNQTLNTMKAAKKSVSKQDEEYRVWYVGITRTMKNLYLVRSPNKSKEFKI